MQRLFEQFACAVVGAIFFSRGFSTALSLTSLVATSARGLKMVQQDPVFMRVGTVWLELGSLGLPLICEMDRFVRFHDRP